MEIVYNIEIEKIVSYHIKNRNLNYGSRNESFSMNNTYAIKNGMRKDNLSNVHRTRNLIFMN